MPGAAGSQAWRPLFDGRSFDGWRGYKREDVPTGWKIEDGAIAYVPGQGRGDLVTRETYGDFVLELEWKVAEAGNSGIIYRATEAENSPWQTGPEMQILDDLRHPDAPLGINGNRKAGSLYDMLPATPGVVKPVGEWNQVRVVARGNHLEHWMNGQRVVSVDVGSDEWNRHLQTSKFKDLAGFGRQPRGHIVLQDHGDRVWFRNIRIQSPG